MSSPVQPPAAFVGYWRPNKSHKWIKLAEGESYQEAWGRLLDTIWDRRGGESLVSQYDPNKQETRR